MIINIRKWGNSYAIRIPKSFADQLDIKENSEIKLNLEKEKIIITKPKEDLNKLLSKVNAENIHKETETGDIKGKELW